MGPLLPSAAMHERWFYRFYGYGFGEPGPGDS